jgi:hypothetical protein
MRAIKADVTTKHYIVEKGCVLGFVHIHPFLRERQVGARLSGSVIFGNVHRHLAAARWFHPRRPSGCIEAFFDEGCRELADVEAALRQADGGRRANRPEIFGWLMRIDDFVDKRVSAFEPPLAPRSHRP